MTIAYDEAVTGFELSDLSVTNGTAGNFTPIVSGSNWSVEVTPVADGEVSISLAAETANDLAGNGSVAAATLTVINDQTAPTVTITSTATSPVNQAFPVTFTFSEAVSGFELGDIQLTNGVASGLTTADNITFSTTITPGMTEGTITVNVAADVANDAAGNGNETAEAFSLLFEFPNNAPTGISLSNNSLAENNAMGDLIGLLTTTDADAEDSFTYSLVAGSGDTDNASFSLNGDQLIANAVFDFETQNSFAIRIETNDGNGGIFSQAFTIEVTNVEEPILRVTANINIEATALGLSTGFEIIVHNDGEGTLEVSNITYPDAFSGPVQASVGAEASEVLNMLFSPTAVGTFSGDIVITTNAGNETVAVSAVGAIITGLDDDIIDADEVSVYPNPAVNKLSIDLTGHDFKPLTFRLVSISGETYFSHKGPYEGPLHIDVSDYRAGVYLLEIVNGESAYTQKVIIRR